MGDLIPRGRRRAHLQQMATDVVHLAVVANELLDTRAPVDEDDGLRSPSLAPGKASGVADPTAATAVANSDRVTHIGPDSSPAELREAFRRHLVFISLHTRQAMVVASLLRSDLVRVCGTCRRPFLGPPRSGECKACARRRYPPSRGA